MLNEKEIALMGLAEAATPGPWSVHRAVIACGQVAVKEDGALDWVCSMQVSNQPNWDKDAQYIAAANPAIILTLLHDLDSTRFAAAQHLQTVETQAKIIAGYAAPSTQQAAGSIDTPEFLGRVIAAASEAMSIGQGSEWDSFIAHIHAWAATTPAQPIAVSAPTDERALYEMQRDAAESAIADELERLGLVACAASPTDEVTQDQAVLLAGIQALCISADQELSRQDGSLSDFDKGWFMGQLHIFDMYTPVEKEAIAKAREYIEAHPARAAAPVSGPTYCRVCKADVQHNCGHQVCPVLVAAPVSGQGASLPQKAELLIKIQSSLDIVASQKAMHPDDYVAVSNTLHNCRDAVLGRGYYGQLCIDSRPRSEDSRAKVLEEAAEVASGFMKSAATAKHIGDAIRAIASTTPQKADDE